MFSNLQKQVAQQSQRDRAAGWVICGQKWKTIFCRRYRSIFSHCDLIGLHLSLLCHSASVAEHPSSNYSFLHLSSAAWIIATDLQQINLPLIYIQRLQSVQNATARLIFNLRRCDHITDAPISLHWLRVLERITFKVATLTYRALHGSVLPYLTSSFTCVAGAYAG